MDYKYRTEVFAEHGCEGAYWCLYDPTKKGYAGLITLHIGMEIEIKDTWRGVIEKDLETNRVWYDWAKPLVKEGNYREILERYNYITKEMSNETCEIRAWQDFSQQHAGPYWCHWVQKGVDPDLWAKWFTDELPVRIIKP